LRFFRRTLVLALLVFPSTARAGSLQPEIELRALSYFLENAHPVSGLVLDSAPGFGVTPPSDRMASLAATGFGLAVLANAAKRSVLPRSEAYDQIERTLRFVRDRVPRRNGWFAHFVDWETGQRYTWSEFSTIDTALFLAGALYAGAVFPDSPAAAIAHELYRDVDFFDMLTDGGAKPEKLTLSMGYAEGYIATQWSMPAEQKILLLLGLGHPDHPLPAKAWLAWNRTALTLPDGTQLMGAGMPLFVHQYSELFVDFREFHDSFGNYFENGCRATRFNRASGEGQTFRQGFWGISAAQTFDGYAGMGPLDQGVTTACLGCAIGSAMFDSAGVLADAERWRAGPYGDKIWGRYGFVDGLDLDHSWFSPDTLGITVGPEFLSLADSNQATSVWTDFQGIPEIRNALERAAHAAQP
jgi:hypothetical protein